MKSLFTFLSLILFSITAHSQILNGGFEDWMGGKPNDWVVTTSETFNADTTRHSGGFSFGWSFWCSDITLGGDPCQKGTFLSNSTNAHPGGSAITKGSSFLSFWYIWGARDTNQRLLLHTSMNSVDTLVRAKRNDSTTDARGWTKFSLPITIPKDSIILQFKFRGGADIHDFTGGGLVLDDISFEMPNAVNSSESSSNIISVSPNPISDHANLHFQSDGVEPIHVTIFDVMGREVLRFPQAESVSGEGMIPFDCKQLPNGLYYLRFEKGNVVVSRKFVVAH